MAAHADELAGYQHSDKGSLHVTTQKPLTPAPLEAIVADRLADLQAT